MFKPNDIVLFQGDSITDASRRRGRKEPNDAGALGLGYVFQTAGTLLRRSPDLGLTIYNRGISGDKVYQLADRWQKDCLKIKPDILSILVGVNDYCHVHRHGYGGTLPEYEHDYETLLERTRVLLPEVKLIIGEPFLLEAGEISDVHVEGITAYREAARRIADKFDAVWVPYQQVFNEALKEAPADYWAPDGVHPTVAGHRLMTEAWLAAVGG